MMWVAWRQFRMPAFMAAAGLGALAVVVVITGRHMVQLYDASGVAPCQSAASSCGGPALDAFLSHYIVLRQVFDLGLLAVPALIGIFWGAPLVAREFETGTWQLAWTQSVSRTRWLAVKFGLGGLASMIVGGMLSFMVSWWSRPVDWVNGNRFNPGTFDERGVVAVGYAAFAFALGITAGSVIRRTLPAMAATLAAFIGVRLATAEWLRPHLWAPLHLSTDLQGIGFQLAPSGVTIVPGDTSAAVKPNAWVYSSQIVDSGGHVASQSTLHAFLQTACPGVAAGPAPGTSVAAGRARPDPAAIHACVTSLSNRFHEVVTYQPASRYWAFQWSETAIFAALALVLAVFCFWWIRRVS
jgi:hypothetical protein